MKPGNACFDLSRIKFFVQACTAQSSKARDLTDLNGEYVFLLGILEHLLEVVRKDNRCGKSSLQYPHDHWSSILNANPRETSRA